MLRNITLFDSKGKTKEEVFKEQEKRAEKKSCVGLCYLTKVRCQPYSLVNPNVIHFYPHVKIDQKEDQIGLESGEVHKLILLSDSGSQKVKG